MTSLSGKIARSATPNEAATPTLYRQYKSELMPTSHVIQLYTHCNGVRVQELKLMFACKRSAGVQLKIKI